MKIATKKKETLKREDFFNVFCGLHNLIDVSICDQLVDKQLKKDEKSFTKMNLQQKMNVILRKDTTKSDLAQFHHWALFSPVTSTMLGAIKNNHIITWPGLSDKLKTKHLPPTLAIAKGHQNLERQGIQSTKPPKSYDDQIKVNKTNIDRLKKSLP